VGSHTGSPVNRIAVTLMGCLLPLAACHPRNRPLVTRLDAALDSLTPGLRLGDDAAALGRKLPGFRMRPDRSYEDTIENRQLGRAGLSLFFEGAFGPTVDAPPPPVARLAAIHLSVATDSQFRRAVASLARWLPVRADTMCAGPEERRWRVVRWQVSPTEMLVATPPVPGASPGYLQFLTTSFASARLAAPRLVACGGRPPA